MAEIKLAGKIVHTNAKLPRVGEIAPPFELVSTRLKNIRLEKFRGKRKLLNIVPSLDTEGCARFTRHLSEMAGNETEVAILVISADLPFAMQRFCNPQEMKNLTCLSMMRSRQFAREYGVLLMDGPMAGITARAVLVLDVDDTVLYSELVADIVNEPDYEAALQIMRS
jgi:thiol peroxidase